jgi:hypothetical protein
MSNHIISILVWINFMPPFYSVWINCFYFPFQLTGLCGGGGDGKSMRVNIVCPSSCKIDEKM